MISFVWPKPTFYPEIPLILIFQKCEFCEKWDFKNMNFVKIETFKMNHVKMEIFGVKNMELPSDGLIVIFKALFLWSNLSNPLNLRCCKWTEKEVLTCRDMSDRIHKNLFRFISHISSSIVIKYCKISRLSFNSVKCPWILVYSRLTTSLGSITASCRRKDSSRDFSCILRVLWSLVTVPNISGSFVPNNSEKWNKIEKLSGKTNWNWGKNSVKRRN